MPHLDPNLVLWATLIADIITTLSSLTAASLMLRMVWKAARAEAEKLKKDL